VAELDGNVGTLRAGELEIRPGEGLVLASGRALTLSVREFDLLVALVLRIGGISSRQDLYRSVWGESLREGDRSVDVYVSKLRNKLESAVPGHRFIHTHPGFGYRFEPQRSRDFHNVEAAPTDTSAGVVRPWRSSRSHAVNAHP
jgi:DNA-binding response OmpR family regulator